jgi:hypothetical protein
VEVEEEVEERMWRRREMGGRGWVEEDGWKGPYLKAGMRSPPAWDKNDQNGPIFVYVGRVGSGRKLSPGVGAGESKWERLAKPLCLR